MPVKIVKATSKGFESVKYMADLELVIMLTIALAILVAITEPIRMLKLVPISLYSPNLSFYLLLSVLLLVFYNLWRMTSAGGIDAYETKISILAAVVVTMVLTIIYFLLSDYLFVDFDKTMQLALMHFTSVTLGYFQGFSIFKKDYFFAMMIFVTFAVVYCFVPVVIKFGNCYVDIMRDIYLQEQSIEHLRRKKEKGEAEEKDNESLEKDADTLKANKSTLRLFNISLTLQMIILFLWVRPLLAPWMNISPHYALIIDGLRFFFIGAHVIVHLLTFKTEISKYMARAYDYISTLVHNPSSENLVLVQRKTRAYIHVLGLMSFQVVAKILVPALLLLLLTQRRLAIIEQSAFNQYHMYDKNDTSYFDWNCVAMTNPRDIVLQATRCPLNPGLEIAKVTPGQGFLSYGLESSELVGFDHYEEAKDVIKKMNKYGLIHSEFYYMMFSTLLFVYYFSTYLLTIVYIFYRKQTEEVV